MLKQPFEKPRSAMFLDRDGVVNLDHGYVHTISKFEWVHGCFEAIKLAKQHGMYVVIITNQSGIARGYYSYKQFRFLNEWMCEKLSDNGAAVDAVYYCPHHPNGNIKEYAKICDCRKPKPGMIIQAISDLEINIEGSILIGDRESDIQAARAAGIEGKLFKSGDLLQFVLNEVFP